MLKMTTPSRTRSSTSTSSVRTSTSRTDTPAGSATQPPCTRRCGVAPAAVLGENRIGLRLTRGGHEPTRRPPGPVLPAARAEHPLARHSVRALERHRDHGLVAAHLLAHHDDAVDNRVVLRDQVTTDDAQVVRGPERPCRSLESLDVRRPVEAVVGQVALPPAARRRRRSSRARCRRGRRAGWSRRSCGPALSERHRASLGRPPGHRALAVEVELVERPRGLLPRQAVEPDDVLARLVGVAHMSALSSASSSCHGRCGTGSRARSGHEVAELDAGEVLDEPEQVGAGRA